MSHFLPRLGLHKDRERNLWLLFETEDHISQKIKSGEIFGYAEVETARRYLSLVHEPLVLDIGANLGSFSVCIAKSIAGQGGRVHAYEPQPVIFMQLNTNLFLNRLQNVHPVCVALGERTEILVTPFIDYGKSANNGAYSLDELARAKLALDEGVDVFRPVYDPTTRMEVRVVPLDSLQLDLSRLALIKIDVEGFESKVLMGGKRTISEGGFPPILYEKWDSDWYQDRANETDQILNEMGYTISNLWGEVWLAQHPLWPIKLKILNTGANDDEGRPVLDLSLTVRDPNSPKLRRGIFGGADRQQEVKT